MNFPHLVASSRWDWRIGDATSERRVASRALLVADVDIGDTAHAPRVGWRAACVHGRDRCVLADVCVRVAIPPMRIMPLMRAA